MPGSSIYINQIDLDSNFFVWATGQDLRKFNGTTWEYYDSLNSAVPSGSPYYLDTRSISIDDKIQDLENLMKILDGRIKLLMMEL